MAASSEKKERGKKTVPERISRGLLGVGMLTERVARPIFAKRGFSSAQLITHWQDIAGPELAANAIPEKVQFERGMRSAGTLHLRVVSGAAAVLIQPQTGTILDRVNAYLGAGTVRRIKITQGPLLRGRSFKRMVPPTPLDEEAVRLSHIEARSIGSDKVRTSLARLGARLKSDRP